MLQYKVPQNVGIEDRIVGPLTLRQLLILTCGIGFSYVLFAILVKFYELNIIEYLVISIPGILSIVAALVRINDQTFTKFMVLAVEYNLKPKRRIWDHRAIAPLVAPVFAKTAAEKKEDPKIKKALNLKELGKILDSGGFENIKPVEHQDIDKTSDEKLVAQAFFGTSKDDKETMYWRTVDSHKERLKVMAKQPATKPVSKPAAPAVVATPPAPQTQQTQAKPVTPAPKPAQQTTAEPARPNHQVNTTGMTKNEPAKFVAKPPVSKPVTPPKAVTPQPQAKPAMPAPKPAPKPVAPPKALTPPAPKPPEKKPEPAKDKDDSEFTFEELKKGDIIIDL